MVENIPFDDSQVIKRKEESEGILYGYQEDLLHPSQSLWSHSYQRSITAHQESRIYSTQVSM